jgi:hypothetical protein
MTRAEAQEALEWGKSQPHIVQAYTNPTHPAYATLQLYSQRLHYWAYEHPQTADGRPVPFEQTPNYQPVSAAEEKRLGALESLRLARLNVALPGEAKDAYENREHARHQEIHEEMARLYQVAEQPADAGDATATSALPAGPVALARQQLAELRQQLADDPKLRDAYLREDHTDHQRVTQLVSDAYAAAYPNPAATATATTPTSE